MKGTVYFADGHTEDIIYYQIFDKYRVKFATESGIYYFAHPDFYKETQIVCELSYTGRLEIETATWRTLDIIRIEIPA